MTPENFFGTSIEIQRNGNTINKTKAKTYLKNGKRIFMLSKDEDIKKGDVILNLDTNQKYEIVDTNPIQLPTSKIHHYETIVKEIE